MAYQIGDKITLSINALSLELERGEQLLSYYRYTIPEQVITVGRTIFGTATINGVARLNTAPKQAFRATILLDEDQMVTHEAIYAQQQALASQQTNPGIVLNDQYQFPHRTYTVFYDPLPDDRFIQIRGQRAVLVEEDNVVSYVDKVYYQFEISGVEL